MKFFNSKSLVFLLIAGVALYLLAPQLFSIVRSTEQVFVPSIGTVTCETTKLSGETISASNPFVGSSKDVDFLGFTSGITNRELDDILGSNTTFALFDTYDCTGRSCIFGVSKSNEIEPRIQCPAGFDLKVYTIYKNGTEIASNGILSLPTGLSTVEANPLSGTTFFENERIDFYARCARQDIFGIDVIRPLSFSIPLTKEVKELVYDVEGVDVIIPDTFGCTRQQLQTLTRSGTETPTATTQYYDASLTLRNQTFNLPATLPDAMNVGEQYTFVYRWESIPAFGNVFVLDDGTRVVKQFVGNTLYEVETVNLRDGSSVNVAGNIYRTNVQCLFNEDCTASFGAGYACDMQSFTCVERPQQECFFDSDCGVPVQWTTTELQTTLTTRQCVSGSCQIKTAVRLCNPTKAYPNNGCISDAPICNSTGTECRAEVIPLTACPAGSCCLSGGDRYYPRGCDEGQECKTNGGYVGICVTEAIDPTCGDGSCNGDETYEICPQDCPETATCEYPFVLFAREEPIWWGLLGTANISSCQLDPIFVFLILGALATTLFFITRTRFFK